MQRLRLPGFLCFLLVIQATAVYATDWIYTAAPGDNLWNLSEQHLDTALRAEQLRKINSITNPKRILPGTRIRIPMKWIRSNPVPARIIAVEGVARLTTASAGESVDVQTETPVRLGDVLITAPGSSAAVRFADGSVITLHSDSEMRFNHLSAHGETGMVDSRVHLIRGRADTRVKPAAGPGSRFEIHTPSAISAVRGTEYRAAVKKQGKNAYIEVLDGRVRVSGAAKKRLIKAGFGTRVEQGSPPSPPRQLLSAPNLKAIPPRIRQINWPLTWQAVPGATQYRVEIGVDDLFNALAWEQVTDRARMPMPNLADGSYSVRVRGIDRDGLEGRSTTTVLEIDTHPQPPVPLGPPDASVFRGNGAQLTWTASADADRYLLEIAEDEDFDQIVQRHAELRITTFDASEIDQPGRYYWRVSSISESDELGPRGAVRSWQIKPIPAGVDPQINAASENKLTASWRQARDDQTFQVQLAFDPDFGELEIDEVTPTPSLGIEQMSGQVRYLRIRAIEPDGYRGPWGTIQRIDPPADNSAWFVPLLGVLGFLLL